MRSAIVFTRELDDSIIPYIENNRYVAYSNGSVFDCKLNHFTPVFNHKNGYLQISLRLTTGKSKLFLLHRVIALAFVDGDKSLIVNHKDGVKTNCDYINLEWIDYSGNNNHAFSMGLMPQGEDSPKSKISREQAIMICDMLDEHKLSYADIAKRSGISSPDASSLISAIYKGVSWKSISSSYNFAVNGYSTSRYRILKEGSETIEKTTMEKDHR